MSKSVSMTIIIISLLSANAFAEKMLFVTADKSPPYTYAEDGKAVGTTAEILLRACGQLGIEAELRTLPWIRALRTAERGEADGIYPPPIQ